jgi:hypothetical protein
MYNVQWICALYSYRIYEQKQMVHNKYCLATEWIRNNICLNLAFMHCASLILCCFVAGHVLHYLNHARERC